MVSVEWLIMVEKDIWPKVKKIMRERSLCPNIVKEGSNTVIIAIPIEPEKIELPEDIERIVIDEDHSAYETWKRR